MKKILFMAGSICFILITFVYVSEMYKIDGYFSVADYQDSIDRTVCDEAVGPIQNAADARIKSEEVLKESRHRFGIDLFNKATVEYDVENKVWLVTINFDHVIYAGFVDVILRGSDGKVLALNGMG